MTQEYAATFRAVPGIAVCGRRRRRRPGLALAGAWTATGWPATLEGAALSGHTAARSCWRAGSTQYRDFYAVHGVQQLLGLEAPTRATSFRRPCAPRIHLDAPRSPRPRRERSAGTARGSPAPSTGAARTRACSTPSRTPTQLIARRPRLQAHRRCAPRSSLQSRDCAPPRAGDPRRRLTDGRCAAWSARRRATPRSTSRRTLGGAGALERQGRGGRDRPARGGWQTRARRSLPALRPRCGRAGAHGAISGRMADGELAGYAAVGRRRGRRRSGEFAGAVDPRFCSARLGTVLLRRVHPGRARRPAWARCRVELPSGDRRRSRRCCATAACDTHWDLDYPLARIDLLLGTSHPGWNTPAPAFQTTAAPASSVRLDPLGLRRAALACRRHHSSTTAARRRSSSPPACWSPRRFSSPPRGSAASTSRPRRSRAAW